MRGPVLGVYRGVAFVGCCRAPQVWRLVVGDFQKLTKFQYNIGVGRIVSQRAEFMCVFQGTFSDCEDIFKRENSILPAVIMGRRSPHIGSSGLRLNVVSRRFAHFGRFNLQFRNPSIHAAVLGFNRMQHNFTKSRTS